MSRPRYTCIESSDTISTSPAARAIASASADLPDAVGPTSARCRVKPPRPGCGPGAGGAGRTMPIISPRIQCGAAFVTRTCTRSPARGVGASGAKCSSLLWRVRPDHIAGSVFDGPSTSTSSTRPTRAACFAQRDCPRPLPSGASSAPGRPRASTKSSVIVAASVPGRGENTNVYAASYCAASTTSSVRSKSSSVSPGNPTMMSVVTARSSIAARAAREPLEVALGGVAAVHARERAVAPRLQRQVQVLAHARALGHRRDRVGAQILRVRRREPDPLDAVDRVDRAQQVGELRPVLPGAEIAAVGVDVLAEQRDLDHAVAGELLDLVHDVAHPAADLAAAHRRHDAERARVVAADLDRDPGRVIDLAAGRQRRRVRVVLLEDLDERTLGPGPGQQRGRVREVVRAEHDVDVRRPLAHQLAVLLREAAATAICRSGRVP